jgi:hypothetical protein
MKSAIFWIATPYSSERVQAFGGIYRLRLQGRNVSKASNRQKQATVCFYWFLVSVSVRDKNAEYDNVKPSDEPLWNGAHSSSEDN